MVPPSALLLEVPLMLARKLGGVRFCFGLDRQVGVPDCRSAPFGRRFLPLLYLGHQVEVLDRLIGSPDRGTRLLVGMPGKDSWFFLVEVPDLPSKVPGYTLGKR